MPLTYPSPSPSPSLPPSAERAKCVLSSAVVLGYAALLMHLFSYDLKVRACVKYIYVYVCVCIYFKVRACVVYVYVYLVE